MFCNIQSKRYDDLQIEEDVQEDDNLARKKSVFKEEKLF